MQALSLSRNSIAEPPTSSDTDDDLGPTMEDDTQPRCHVCRVLLGPFPCPNPECPVIHGAQAGTLCVWCQATRPGYRPKQMRTG